MPLPRSRMPLPRSRVPLRRSGTPPLRSRSAPDAAPLLRDAAPPLPDAAPTAGYAAPPEPEPEPEPTADMPSRAARVTETRDFDKTGNVRLLTTEEAGVAGPGPATGAAATASEAGTAVPDAPPPPLLNYDELSIASLRARLRVLDVTQLRQLVEYEKAHAARGDVVAMFERRIAKLEAGA